MSFWVYVNGRFNIEIFNKVLRHERQPIAHKDELGVGRNLIRTFFKGSSLLPTKYSAKMAQKNKKRGDILDDSPQRTWFAVRILEFLFKEVVHKRLSTSKTV